MSRTKIVVHNPQNEHTKGYRYYNYFFEEFIKNLYNHFDVEENTYFKNAHIESFPIKLLGDDSMTSILECEMVIENKSTKEFVVVSVADQLTSITVNHQNNPLCTKVLISQFNEKTIRDHVADPNNFKKYSPWIYFPSNKFDLDGFYSKRKSIKNFIDSFAFWGSGLEDRSILKFIDSPHFKYGLPIGGFDTYADNLINYKVALSVSGRAEFCYRDIENFGMGIPILRFDFTNTMFKPLIPNFHYIAVKNPNKLVLDKHGEVEHAMLLTQRFLEVKDDYNFLVFISDNAKKYYEDNLTVKNSIDLTYNLLNLNTWE